MTVYTICEGNVYGEQLVFWLMLIMFGFGMLADCVLGIVLKKKDFFKEEEDNMTSEVTK